MTVQLHTQTCEVPSEQVSTAKPQDRSSDSVAGHQHQWPGSPQRFVHKRKKSTPKNQTNKENQSKTKAKRTTKPTRKKRRLQAAVYGGSLQATSGMSHAGGRGGSVDMLFWVWLFVFASHVLFLCFALLYFLQYLNFLRGSRALGLSSSPLPQVVCAKPQSMTVTVQLHTETCKMPSEQGHSKA